MQLVVLGMAVAGVADPALDDGDRGAIREAASVELDDVGAADAVGEPAEVEGAGRRRGRRRRRLRADEGCGAGVARGAADVLAEDAGRGAGWVIRVDWRLGCESVGTESSNDIMADLLGARWMTAACPRLEREESKRRIENWNAPFIMDDREPGATGEL